MPTRYHFLSLVPERTCFYHLNITFIRILFQIYQPWIQSRRIAYSKHKHVLSGFLKHVHNEVFGRLLNDDGSPNTPVIEKLVNVSFFTRRLIDRSIDLLVENL